MLTRCSRNSIRTQILLTWSNKAEMNSDEKSINHHITETTQDKIGCWEVKNVSRLCTLGDYLKKRLHMAAAGCRVAEGRSYSV